MLMTYEEVKEAVLKLSESDQKRLILEVIPQIWPKACTDDACLNKVRELVDEDAVRSYREQHMGGI
jgi:peroxiredoxin